MEFENYLVFLQKFLNSMIQTLSKVTTKKATTEKDDKFIKWTYNEVIFEVSYQVKPIMLGEVEEFFHKTP